MTTLTLQKSRLDECLSTSTGNVERIIHQFPTLNVENKANYTLLKSNDQVRYIKIHPWGGGLRE